MQERLDLPRQFNMTYQAPELGKTISFNVYREPSILSWNGYYKEHRIRIWNTSDFWVVAGYVMGMQACYFRSGSKEPDLKEIKDLVQCTCYFIDLKAPKNENT